MPHITVEATPRLANSVDFVSLFESIHRGLAEAGHAKMEDFKSRVLTSDVHLAGDDRQGEFVVARLVTTHPRPPEEGRAMASYIHDALKAAIERDPRDYWWQVCVLIERFELADYFKTDTMSTPKGD